MSTAKSNGSFDWALVDTAAVPREIAPGVTCGDTITTLAQSVLELRARVEALEAGATCPHIRSSDEGTSYCALAEQTAAAQPAPTAAPAPASSLVERVHNAILAVEDDDDEDDPGFKYTSAASRIGQGLVDLQARAAIREVAAWMRENECGYNAVRWLEQEANR